MLTLARIFSDNMILQRHMPICLWGNSDRDDTVSVRLNGRHLTSAEVKQGDFSLSLPAQEALTCGTLEIIAGDHTVTLRNIAIGEVWVAGGQSNMEFMLQYDRDGDAEIAAANDTDLRVYTVGQYSFPGEREMGYKAWNPWDRWLPFLPENAKELPAVAIYFAKELREQGVPVGIINCTWGGTTASAWMDKALLAADPELKVYTDEFDALAASLNMERFRLIRSMIRPAMASPDSQKTMSMILKNTFHPAQLQQAMAAAMQGDAQQNTQTPPAFPGGIDPTTLSREELLQEGPGDKCEPGSLYENMLKEIEGYSTKGVIWYQGESDDKKAPIYAKLFAAMIDCWRKGWRAHNPGQQKLPFLFVQIAPYGVWMNNTSENYPELRRQQQVAANSVPDVYMASIGDIGNVYDIHPKEKRPVGHRLALLARKYIYNEQLLADAPSFESIRREKDTLSIRFKNGENLRLIPQDHSSYNGFSVDQIDAALLPPVLDGICGLEVLADGAAVTDAVCRVENDTLSICSKALESADKIQVRYCETPFYRANLLNEAAIPVLPFTATL